MFLICKQNKMSLILNTVLFKCNKTINLRLFYRSYQLTQHSVCDNIKKLNVKNALITHPSQQLVAISGWIRSTRKQKPIFLHLSDGSVNKYLQIVIDEELTQTFDISKQLHNGCCIRCVGHLVPSRGRQQSTELLCKSIEILGDCDPSEYPFAQRNSTYEMPYFREFLHLRVRNPLFASMARIRSETINAFHIFMKQNDFINITTPIITSNDCEGGGEVFTIQSNFCTKEEQYFGKQTYLSVSSQLYLEAMVEALSRVYTLTQCFRAEKALSRKHLSEFLMFEAEECFVDTIDELMDRVETICKFIAYYINQNCCDDLNVVLKHTQYKHFDKIANSKYIRMTYSEVIDMVQKSGKFPNFKIGQNLNAEMEKMIVDYNNKVPVFVTHYPKDIKPFYMKQFNEQALCFDLLSPICGEICGGSLREDSFDELEKRINLIKSSDNLKWYLDLRRFGSALHGGFGIGFDRLLQTMTGVQNIKDVSTFPRWLHHCPL